MDRRTIVERVEALAEPALAKLGMEVVDVEYLHENGHWVLRLSIDKPGGVTLDDCVAVTRLLDTPLDTFDFIPQRYHLEVASPGIERPLKKDKDFVTYRGQQVRIKTATPVDGRRNIQGTLLGIAGAAIQLRLDDGQQLEIPREAAASVRLAAVIEQRKPERKRASHED